MDREVGISLWGLCEAACWSRSETQNCGDSNTENWIQWGRRRTLGQRGRGVFFSLPSSWTLLSHNEATIWQDSTTKQATAGAFPKNGCFGMDERPWFCEGHTRRHHERMRCARINSPGRTREEGPGKEAYLKILDLNFLLPLRTFLHYW